MFSLSRKEKKAKELAERLKTIVSAVQKIDKKDEYIFATVTFIKESKNGPKTNLQALKADEFCISFGSPNQSYDDKKFWHMIETATPDSLSFHTIKPEDIDKFINYFTKETGSYILKGWDQEKTAITYAI